MIPHSASLDARWSTAAALTKRYERGRTELVRRSGDESDPCTVYAIRESVDVSAEEDAASLESRFLRRVCVLSRRQFTNVAEILDAEVTDDHVLTVVEMRLEGDTPPLTLERFLTDAQRTLTAAQAEALVDQILYGLVELETALETSGDVSMAEVFGDLTASDVLIFGSVSECRRAVLSRAAFGFLAHEGIRLRNALEPGNACGGEALPQQAPWIHLRKIIETIQEHTRGSKSPRIAKLLKSADADAAPWSSWRDVREAWLATSCDLFKKRQWTIGILSLLVGIVIGFGPTWMTGQRKVARLDNELSKANGETASLQKAKSEAEKKLQDVKKRLDGAKEQLEVEQERVDKLKAWCISHGIGLPTGIEGTSPPPPPDEDVVRQYFEDIVATANSYRAAERLAEHDIPDPQIRKKVLDLLRSFDRNITCSLLLNKYQIKGTSTGADTWYVYLNMGNKSVISGAPWKGKKQFKNTFVWKASSEMRLRITYKRWGFRETTIYERKFDGPFEIWKLHRALQSGASHKTDKRTVTIWGSIEGCPEPPKTPGAPAKKKAQKAPGKTKTPKKRKKPLPSPFSDDAEE